MPVPMPTAMDTERFCISRSYLSACTSIIEARSASRRYVEVVVGAMLGLGDLEPQDHAWEWKFERITMAEQNVKET